MADEDKKKDDAVESDPVVEKKEDVKVEENKSDESKESKSEEMKKKDTSTETTYDPATSGEPDKSDKKGLYILIAIILLLVLCVCGCGAMAFIGSQAEDAVDDYDPYGSERDIAYDDGGTGDVMDDTDSGAEASVGNVDLIAVGKKAGSDNWDLKILGATQEEDTVIVKMEITNSAQTERIISSILSLSLKSDKVDYTSTDTGYSQDWLYVNADRGLIDSDVPAGSTFVGELPFVVDDGAKMGDLYLEFTPNFLDYENVHNFEIN